MTIDPNWISAIVSVIGISFTITTSALQAAKSWKRLQRRRGQSRSTATTTDTKNSQTEHSRKAWFFKSAQGFMTLAVIALVWLVVTGLSVAPLTRGVALLMSALTAWFVLSVVITMVYAIAAALAPQNWLDDSTR